MRTAQTQALPQDGLNRREEVAYGARVMEGLRRSFLFLLPILAMICVWELVVRIGWADPTILPAPSTVAARAVQLLNPADPAQGVLAGHILASLWRALAAFALAVVIAIPLGLVLGLSRVAYDWTSPILSLLLPLPAVAWTPVFLVIFGQGDATIIGVCFLGAVFPVLYSTIQGVRGVSRHSIWVIRSMGGSAIDLLVRVLLPSSLPAVMSGLKLGMAHSWRTLVAAEMLAALSSGLGYMIFAARAYMDVATMFAGIVCLAVIGMIIEHGLFGPLEKLTIRRWHATGRIGGTV